MKTPISVTSEKVTTPRQWRGTSSWRTNVRRFVLETKTPKFVLLASGAGMLFYFDGQVRQKTWPSVRVIWNSNDAK